ncbi:MAG: FkbM family methyltransferase [Beijerinckiaceae bacterium]
MTEEAYSANPRSYGSLKAARKLLADNSAQRDKILDCLIEIEKTLQSPDGANIREDLTGPIVDLLFEEGELLQRTVAGGMTFRFRYSSKISRDFLLARGRVPDHVWEPQTTRSVVALSRGKQNVLIGGAYIGDHALYAARLLSEGGICHCFELSDDSLELLRTNLAINAIKNVTVNQEALWSSDGEKIVLAGEDSHASPQIADSGESRYFVSRTIDSYMQSNDIKNLDLLMLDIEGGEFDALSGAKSALRASKELAPAVICEIHSNYVDWSNGLRNTPLCKLLIDNGYEVFAIRDYQGNEVVEPPQVELVDIDSAIISGPAHGFNLLAVKSRQRLSSDTFRIVHGVSPKLLKHRDPKLHAPLTHGHEFP